MNTTQGQSSETISAFVDALVKEKGFVDIPAEVVDEMKRDLASRVEDRLNAAILAKLPPERLGDFEKLLDLGSETNTQAFCREHIADLDEVVASELLSFRQTYLNP